MQRHFNLYNDDCLNTLKALSKNSVDSIITDPPYGYNFMGKSWDKALPSVDIWKECYRVLKPGGFAFIMSSPRIDVAGRMSILLEDAGFITSFSPIYWVYTSGFPKGYNMGQSAEKLLTTGAARRPDRDLGGVDRNRWGSESGGPAQTGGQIELTTNEAKKLKNSYGGFQPKPAVELIMVVMKPLSKKNYVEQALDNNGGITNLLDCNIINHNEDDRMMSNLIMENGILGDNSKYFQIDTWWESKLSGLGEKVINEFPFLLVKKPNRNEKESGVKSVDTKIGGVYAGNIQEKNSNSIGSNTSRKPAKVKNDHPTVKPIQLMSYLVNLGSSVDEVVLDPFMGSGTTGISSVLNNRKFIGIELDNRYYKIAKDRIEATQNTILKFT